MTYETADTTLLDDILVDLKGQTCRKNGVEIELAPLSFRLLLCLIEADGQPVEPELLKEKVWQGIAVTDDSLKQRVRILRKALGDDGETPKLIGAERHKGYKLLIRPKAPSTMWGFKRSIILQALAAALVVFALITAVYMRDEEKGIILVVMPFETEEIGPEASLFTRGLTYELISRINSMPVLSTVNLSSAALYSDRRARDVAKEFNADAIVEGSVSRREGYLKVNVQMTDGESEKVIWSSVYERSMPDIFEIQRDITFHIALVLNQDFDPSTAEHLKDTPTKNYEAYALFIQALGYEGQRHEDAISLLERAVSLDPDFKAARAQLKNIREEK